MGESRLNAALRWRARLLIGALALHILWTVLSFGYGVLTFTDNGSAIGDALGAALLLNFFAVLPTLCLIVVAAALWVWRAHANLRDLGFPSLAYAPLWAASSWFVPGINLVIPPRAMRELWRNGQAADQRPDQPPVAAISGWWWCLIGGALFEAISLVTAFLASVPGALALASPLLAAIIGASGVMLLLIVDLR
ncbi:DUF4328 domain-containing protein [Novosphingobium sp. Chol11]|uniref:DUF4328 domain-containing protein n=1 Tax=Novosphingobium sp. Chol11 TaxID=1385763 RepID=UPI0025E9AF39|nr:DUF4328 domain-containing protein [Novosphingobium sp. Chol11]